MAMVPGFTAIPKSNGVTEQERVNQSQANERDRLFQNNDEEECEGELSPRDCMLLKLEVRHIAQCERCRTAGYILPDHIRIIRALLHEAFGEHLS